MHPQDQTDREIKRFQALFPFLDREYRHLLSVFETLKLTTTEELQSRVVNTPRAVGFSVVASALLSSCVIVAHRILSAGRKSNPSLCQSVRPFVGKNQKEHAKLLARLEQLYPTWPDLIVRWKGTSSHYYIPKPAPKNSPSVEDQKRDFWQRVEIIRSEWAYLSTACKTKLDVPRDKVFAHLELEELTFESPAEEQPTGGRAEHRERSIRHEQEVHFGFQTISEPDPEELWKTLREVVPRTGNCIAQVGYVWRKACVDYPEAQRAAESGAAAFWRLFL